MDFTKESQEKYQRIVEDIRKLPSLPEIATKLMEVVNSPDTSADDAASLIKKDLALTSTVLRMANSAFYGMPRTISSVSSAVVILGFNTIRSIVLSASILKVFSSKGRVEGFNHQRFWRHSILCAIGAKLIAKQLMHILMLDPESAFCAGILHDIGKLIFEQYVPEDYTKACQYAVNNKISLVKAEKEVMGITHTEIGNIISDKWALPLDLENALVYHHDPKNMDKSLNFVTTIHCADQMAHKAGADLWDNEEIEPEWEGVYSTLGFEEDDYTSCLNELKNNMDKPTEFLALVSYAE